MKITQDPHLPNRFIVSYQFVDQVVRGNHSPDVAFTTAGMRRAFVRDDNSWFHVYAAKKLAKDKVFKPVRVWLKETKADAVYQERAGGVTLPDRYGWVSIAVDTAGFAMTITDMGKAALFKMWIAGFNDAEEVRLGIS